MVIEKAYPLFVLLLQPCNSSFFSFPSSPQQTLDQTNRPEQLFKQLHCPRYEWREVALACKNEKFLQGAKVEIEGVAVVGDISGCGKL